jgi:catechol 2,3-dioxygenase-like lactoylglutathione lyase family enzyme
MEPIAIKRINHVGVVAANLEASVAWYVRHLGFERLYDYSFPGVTAAFIRKGELRLEFFQSDGASPMADERRDIATNVKIGGINHFALEVDDIEATFAALAANGVEVVQPPAEIPDSGGEKFGFIKDLEGMLIEFFQPCQSS